MNSKLKRPCGNVLSGLILSVCLLALTACGVFEVGIETRVPVSTATAVGLDTTAATPTAAPTETRPVPKMMTPTPSPAPGGPLRLAFAREGDVWLWAGGGAPAPLTQTGDVGESSVKKSRKQHIRCWKRSRLHRIHFYFQVEGWRWKHPSVK